MIAATNLSIQQKFILCLNVFFRHLDNSKLDNSEELFEYNFRGGKYILEQLYPYITRDFLKGKIVLDYGCGDGGKTLYFSSFQPKEVIGVDVAEDLYTFQAVFKRVKENNIKNIRFELIENNQIPLADNLVDIIISSSVFEHISDPIIALNDCFRVLKPNGIFALRWHPFYSRYGGHVNYAIGIPYAHLIFNEEDIMKVWEYKVLKKFGKLPFFFRNMKQFERIDDYIPVNRLRIKDFNKLIAKTKFNVIDRIFLLNKRKLSIPKFFYNSRIIDYFIDYEIYFLTKL